jgi:hypothetical protein
MRKKLNVEEVIAASQSGVNMGMLGAPEPKKKGEARGESVNKPVTNPKKPDSTQDTATETPTGPRAGATKPKRQEKAAAAQNEVAPELQIVPATTSLPETLDEDLRSVLRGLPYDEAHLLRAINDRMSEMATEGRVEITTPRTPAMRRQQGVSRQANVKVPTTFIEEFRKSVDPLKTISLRKIAEQWFDLHCEQAVRDLLKNAAS